MFWEILKSSKGLPVDDPIAALWGQKMSGGWAVTELTGELPLAFLSDGGALKNYRIYGTASGSGTATGSGEPAGYKIPLLISDKKPEIYGWHIDPSISDPTQAITYLGDAVGKTPAAMGASTFSYGGWENAFFMPKPCMVKSDGTVDYYLDPNDYTKKLDGTDSDAANADYDGNAMMEWPLIWWKYEAGETEGEGYFYVSNVKVDESYHCYCNINCDNQIVEHFYTAIYNGTGTTKLRSISGVALTSANGNGGTTYSQESTRAMANNTTAKTEWFIDVWSDRMLINGLLILIGKSLNSQVTFGRGLDTDSQTAKEAYVTGSLNDKGLFWGDISAGTSGVKVFGMENWYGCTYHRTAGLVGLANGNTAYKMTYGTADGTTANGYNATGDGYHINTVARPAGDYVKSCKFGDFGYLPLSTTGGSASTYYTDYWHTYNIALTFALVGGASNRGASGGVSFFALDTAASSANWAFAAALTLKPLVNPITLHESNYDLFVGSTKLGEEEYVEYRSKRADKLIYDRTSIDDASLRRIRIIIDAENSAVLPAGVTYATTGLIIYRGTECPELTRESAAAHEDIYDYNLPYAQFQTTVKDTKGGIFYRGYAIMSDGTLIYGDTVGVTLNEQATEIIETLRIVSTDIPLYPTIWKDDGEGNIVPTDPPAPLPAISTYKGENTLSSTETVGSVTIRGKIKEST